MPKHSTVLGRLFCGLGALLILGTAGASDHGSVPMNHIILHCVIGFGLIALGALLNKLSLIIRRYRYAQRHHH